MIKMPFSLPKEFQTFAAMPFELPMTFGKSLFEGGQAMDQIIGDLQSKAMAAAQKGLTLPATIVQSLPKFPLSLGGEIVGKAMATSGGTNVRTTIF